MVDDGGVGVGVGLDGSVSGLLGWLVVGLGGVVTGFVLGCTFGVFVFVGVGLGWAWVVLVNSVTCCWLVFCWLLCGRLCLVSVFWVFVFWLGWLLGCWRWFGFKILGMSFTLDNIGCRMVGGWWWWQGRVGFGLGEGGDRGSGGSCWVLRQAQSPSQVCFMPLGFKHLSYKFL